MDLSPHGREPYKVTLTTVPAITAWEASFDGGVTWVAGTPVTGTPNQYAWLVAGPSAPPAPGGTSLAATLVRGANPVLVRGTDTPSLIVRNLAGINVA